MELIFQPEVLSSNAEASCFKPEVLSSNIAHVSLTSEAARREVLIAPILLEVAHITKAIVNILEILMQILVGILMQG